MSTIQLKRSSVASKVPLTSDLALGELAMNTNDGLLFFKKDPGTPSIVTLVTTDATQTLTNKTLTSPTINSGAISGTFSGSATFSGSLTAAGNSSFTGALVNITSANTTIGDAATDVLNVNAVSVFNANTTIRALIANGSIGTSGQVLTSNSTGTYWSTVGANLSLTANGSTVSINSDSGTDVTILAANATTAGVLTAEAQTIGGAKSFTQNVTVSSDSTGTLTLNRSADDKYLGTTYTTAGTTRWIQYIANTASADMVFQSRDATGAVIGAVFALRNGPQRTDAIGTLGIFGGGGGTYFTNITNPTLSANRTLTLADGNTTLVAGTMATLTGSETLTNKTLTSPLINGNVGISGILTQSANATFSGALVNITGANTTIGDAATDVLNVNAISVFNANTTLKGSEILIDNASGSGGSAEGGELHFAIPTANTTLSGPIAIDIYQNKIRFFETTGTNRGAYIDLTAASTSAGSNLLAGAGTNITQTSNGSTVTVFSDTGTDAIILASNSTTAGILTAEAQTIGGSKTFVSNTTFSANTTLSYGFFGTTNGQTNASSGAFISNAYAYFGGAGGNYLALGQQTNFAQWIQSGYSAASPVYYSIILNPLGGNIGIGNTTPVDKLSVDGTVNVTGNTAIAGVLAITKHTETVTTATVSSLTYNIDLSLSNVFNLTLSSNTTFTFTNPPAAGVLKPVTVILTQDATGGRTVSFNSVKYTDGTAPQFTTTANAIDVMTFFTVNGGSWYFGTFAMAAVA